MGHYLIEPLAERGMCCMGLNSRYAGNDTVLLMERVIQDLGAGVKFLHEAGYDRVVLIGNSGGAALASFYQAQAEQFQRRHLRRRRPDAPEPERSAAGRRHRPVRRARGALEAAARLDRPVGDRRARRARGRRRARHVRRAPCGAVQRRVPRALSRGAARAARPHRGMGARAAAHAARHAGRAARRVVHRAPHARRPALRRSVDRRERSRAGQRVGRCAIGQLRGQLDGPHDIADRVPVAMVVALARRRPDEPRAHERRRAAADLHRRPVDVPEHARRMAGGGGTRIRNVDVRGANHYLAGQPQLVARGRRRRSPRGPKRCSRMRDGNLSLRAGLRAADLPLRAAGRTRRRAAPPLSGRHRRRRAVGPDARMRPRATRRARRAARRGRHGRRARRVVARHLLRAKEPRDLRPARHLRSHHRQGRHLVGRQDLFGRQRGLRLQPGDQQRVDAAAVHQPAAVLRRVVPGRSHPAARPAPTCAGRTA